MALAGWRSQWIKRGKFELADERFEVDGIPRYSTESLKRDFLPRLSPEANRLLRRHHNFVRSQLIHYGVEFNDKNLTGHGTRFLKKALEAGLMDRVPQDIEQMREEMRDEYFVKLPIQELAQEYPLRFVKQYFLNDLGGPDRTRTTTVLEIEGVDHRSDYTRRKVEQALNTVPGLHYTSSPSSMFIGWDPEAVNSGPRIQAEKIVAEEKAKSDARIALHEKYAKEMSAEGSPVGVYLIDCEEIQNGWERGEDLELSIRESDCKGIYEADFEFNIISGAMMLSTDKATINEHCARLAKEEEKEEYGSDISDEDDSENDSDGDVKPTPNGKRVRFGSEDTQPQKKAKKTADGDVKLFLKWRGRESGEGEIGLDDNEGAIIFTDPRHLTFSGRMDMGPIGSNVLFTGMKISGNQSKRIESAFVALLEGSKKFEDEEISEEVLEAVKERGKGKGRGKGEHRIIIPCSAAETLIFGSRIDESKVFGRKKNRASRALGGVEKEWRSVDMESDEEEEGPRNSNGELIQFTTVGFAGKVRPPQEKTDINASVGGEKGWAERTEETNEAAEKRREGQRVADEKEMVKRAARRGCVFGFEGPSIPEQGKKGKTESFEGGKRMCEAVMNGIVVEPSFAKGDWGIRWRE
ncbi:hypothetical protein BLS_001044 [Venturia inaequalis]|uniref:Uncharacterized protein n=1 Tax=Venturia inaequalis TaxID=5025 RepID=A0A8H3U2C9_VENIN|nr:hypothetical protein BLS_001044 [Venturia inaequalis]